MRFRFLDVVAVLIGLLITSAATTVSAQGVQHFTKAQIAAQCRASWDQDIATGAPDVVATVNAYRYTFTVDSSSTSAPITATCTGSAAPYQCTGTYMVPIPAQSVGTHTMVVSATDAANQSVGGLMVSYIVDPDPIGPPPAPKNWRFIIGGLIAALLIWVGTVAHG